MQVVVQNMSQQTQHKFDASTPVQFVKGVGPARAKVFAELGVHTVSDLLEYFPRDWVFAPEPTQIGQVRAGRTVTIVGMVESTDYQSFRRQPLFEAMVSDETGTCRIVWFHVQASASDDEPEVSGA